MPEDIVVLTVPARDEYARTVRMTVATLLGRTAASIDLVDEVRMAVEEAFIYACRIGSTDGSMTFEFSLEDDAITVTVGPLVAPHEEEGGDDVAEGYSRFILEAVCDEFGACELEEDPYIRIVKRLVEG